MPFEIVRNDIVKMDVDAIVNTANPQPIVGGGVDSAIHKSAGPELLKARKAIGDIAVGDAVITKGFNLLSQYVIHTAGPVWCDGTHDEERLLASCYRKSLELALQNSCESVAFPLISTGTYGFPKREALQIAVREFSSFLMEHDMQIYLVIFGNEELMLSEKLFKSVKRFVDKNYIRAKLEEEYGFPPDILGCEALPNRFFRRAARQQKISNAPQSFLAARGKFLADELPDMEYEVCSRGELLDDLEATVKREQQAGFSETLLDLIKKTGKKDSDIYRKANIDRKLFSKIRNNPDYHPSKETVMAFALALELRLPAAEKLLACAGLAFSDSSKFDLVVKYFFKHRIYDVNEVNTYLFDFELPLLGASCS